MKKILLIFLLVCLLPPYLGAAGWSFTHINTDNSDLSYNGISRIFQDSRGSIWVGTFKGLNRYDGTRFKVYYKDDLGLESDFIHQIAEDAEGNLWIGTDAGVSRYLWKEARFEPILAESDLGTVIRNKVTCICPGSGGLVWMAVNYQGIFSYDIKTSVLRNHLEKAPVNMADNYGDEGLEISFRRLAEDGKGGLWLSRYHDNIYHADKDFRHVTAISLDGGNAFYEGDEVEWLHLRDSLLYVASRRRGLTVADLSSGSVRQLFKMPPADVLTSAYLSEDDDRIWLSTTGGVWSYSFTDGSYFHIEEDRTDRFSISGNYVFTTMVDREGGLWIGTKDGGISYSCPSRKHFAREYRGLEKAIVSGFACDSLGKMYVTTESASLFICEKNGSGPIPCKAHLPSTLCSPCFDGRNLWMGSLDGIWTLDTLTGEVRKRGTLKRGRGVDDPRVYIVYRTRSGKLYAANTLGLYRYSEEQDDFIHIKSLDGVFVTGIAETPGGHLVLSSYAVGLYVFDPLTDSVLRHFRRSDGSGIPTDKISSAFVDENGSIWGIGFDSGIFRLDGDVFTVFDRRSVPAFPTDVFFCAAAGEGGSIWLSSDKGVLQFNPSSGEVSRYTVFDGLIDDALTNCIFKNGNGELFFGSENGFVHFNPGDLKADIPVPELTITSVRVGNRVLDGNPDLCDRLTLKSSENSFGIEFSCLSSLYPSARRHQCKLEGLDAGWRDVPADNSLFWYDVRRGTYRLLMRSSVAGGEWHECRRPMEVTVLPGFFASWPGIALILLAVIAMALLVAYILNRRAERRRAREEEAWLREKDEETRRDKMNFFSHVIHEIKTPLTLIMTPLRNLLSSEELGEGMRRDLTVMENNAASLTGLVNELLEYVRTERQGYMLNRVPIDLLERISKLVFNFSDSTRDKNLKVEFEPPVHPVWVSADSQALDKILGNLFFNALKYAETYIRIGMETEGEFVRVSFSNDGAPIPDDFREEIFKPFVRYNGGGDAQRRPGVGLGLPLARNLARIHSGDIVLCPGTSDTTFLLSLPLAEAPAEPELREEAIQTGEENRPLILLVDDNPDLCNYLSGKLSDEWQVDVAADVSGAMEILRARNVSMLVTDLSMPGGSGLELCRMVREETEISHIPIIVLSARTSVESKVGAMEAGADIYIEKPFDLDYLRSCIRHTLDRRRLMRSALGSGVQGVDVSIFGLPRRDEEFLVKFDKLVTENMCNSELSVADLAGELGMSHSTLLRKIKKLLDTTPVNYINAKRLVAAASMLRDNHGNNISEICYSLGFTSVSYFSKCFRLQYGVTPTEYAMGKSAVDEMKK